MGDDPGPDRGLRRRCVRVRGHAARQRGHRQRGRPRARRARAPPTAPPRSTSASSRRSRGTYQVRVPGGALLSPPVSGDLFGGGSGRDRARRPAGRPGPGPRPRGRVRVAADGPCRDGGRPSRSSRPTSASRTGGSRARSRTPRTRPWRSRPSCSAPPSPSSRTWRPATTATVDVAVQTRPPSSASRSRTSSSGRLFFDGSGAQPGHRRCTSATRSSTS